MKLTSPISSSSLLLTALFITPSLTQSNKTSLNGCQAGFYPGFDTVIYTVPYTYSQVMSIIGDYKNISWSGIPYDNVTLTGPDNTVGTSRLYDLDGAHINETITVYSKPPQGPYYEVHTVALLSIPAVNLSVYSDYDGTTVLPMCNGTASTFNFTINFCATNSTLAAGLLHTLHLTDAKTVGVFLGNQTFSNCSSTAVVANGTSTGGGGGRGAPSATTSTPPAMFTGSGANQVLVAGNSLLLAVVVVVGVVGAGLW